jgi:hypothetical protein
MLVNAGLLVTISLFFLGYLITEAVKRRDQRALRRKYLLALCTEIDLNTEWLDKSIRNMPPTSAIRTFLEAGPANMTSREEQLARACFRPHLINNYLDQVFKQHTSVLADMPDDLIRSIIKFYDKLDWIDLTVKSIENQSFASISVTGREAILESVRLNMHEALAHGTEVRSTIRLLLEPRRVV